MAEKTVAEVMDRDPETVGSGDDVRTVIQLMRDHELPAVPVVDGDRRVVGIVTDNDLVISDEEDDLHLPHYFNLMGATIFLQPVRGFEERLRKAFATKVSDLMTPDPLCCAETDSVKHAARLIVEKHHNRLPVIDSEGHLAGVVTRADVLAALAGGE
jgi:CBS domain-containing protein